MIIADKWRVRCKGESHQILTELSMIMRALLEEEIVDHDLLETLVNISSKDEKRLEETYSNITNIKQYADQIIQIIEHCEEIQEDGCSEYHKERAKIHAYEDIVALVKVRR